MQYVLKSSIHNITGPPVPGQLVSMAIPLGEPRLEPGVRQSATPLRQAGKPVTSTPVPVTAARNAAVVSFPHETEADRLHSPVRARSREHELAKQVTHISLALIHHILKLLFFINHSEKTVVLPEFG